MITDLAVTAMIGACVLAAIAAMTAWLARSITSGTLPFGGRLALRPRGVARTPEALLDANRAAAQGGTGGRIDIILGMADHRLGGQDQGRDRGSVDECTRGHPGGVGARGTRRGR